MPFDQFLNSITAGEPLAEAEARVAMLDLVSGSVGEEAMADFLLGLNDKGIEASEVSGFVSALREQMITIQAPEGAIDVCGTGGDHSNSFNISTTVSLVVSSCGVPMAKHGNRSISSKSGSADLLRILGLPWELDPQQAEAYLEDKGFVFLMAPKFHPALAAAAPVRKKLKKRTVFNLLGPLLNPARVKRQLIGVYSPEGAELMARGLVLLGTENSLVVHGAGGMDELTTLGVNQAWRVRGKKITEETIDPEAYGLSMACKADLQGGSPEENAEITLKILEGEKGPRRDVVLLNAGAALEVAGKADSIERGIALAKDSLDIGQARAFLELLRMGGMP